MNSFCAQPHHAFWRLHTHHLHQQYVRVFLYTTIRRWEGLGEASPAPALPRRYEALWGWGKPGL